MIEFQILDHKCTYGQNRDRQDINIGLFLVLKEYLESDNCCQK